MLITYLSSYKRDRAAQSTWTELKHPTLIRKHRQGESKQSKRATLRRVKEESWKKELAAASLCRPRSTRQSSKYRSHNSRRKALITRHNQQNRDKNKSSSPKKKGKTYCLHVTHGSCVRKTKTDRMEECRQRALKDLHKVLHEHYESESDEGRS